ncbi:MAG: peptidoglycan editing factor PgeF, partial [Candidatus Gastranaerophilales bacterium]|nr:peptidoglycan editing factor PgeF [Candidatus Gastranaerophilales bacterium]
ILKTKEKENIQKAENNRTELIKAYNLNALISPEQRHTCNIKIVSRGQEYKNTDALILNQKNTGIFLNFADCTPIILFDKIKNIIAIAHAGWRGCAEKIGFKTVLKMKNEFLSNPKDITALIGPCICFEDFETSFEIADTLSKTAENGFKYIKEKNGRFYSDLKNINRLQLEEAGVITIEIAPYCTYCNNELFFSYRKENKTTNRISAFACLN